jgi:hypothetical protein
MERKDDHRDCRIDFSRELYFSRDRCLLSLEETSTTRKRTGENHQGRYNDCRRTLCRHERTFLHS